MERDAGESTKRRPTFTGGQLPPGRPVALPAVPAGRRYAMSDLERETGFNARTIRFYIANGLIASAHGRGPTATYDEDHLLRLRMIGELKEHYLPLEQIKERLAHLTTEDLAAHFAVQRTPEQERWRRVMVHPDLELHVRERDSDRGAAFEAVLAQIVQYARAALEQHEREWQVRATADD